MLLYRLKRKVAHQEVFGWSPDFYYIGCGNLICLKIGDVICDTHAEDDDWEELKIAMALKSDQETGFGIPTGSCLVVHPDHNCTALGGPVIRYGNENGRIKQLPDLEPG